MSTSAPPELPGLIAASVWTAFITVSWPVWPLWVCSAEDVRTGRFSAETMPEVTVADRPSGEPMATTGWPTSRLPDDAEGGRGQAGDALGLDDGEVVGGGLADHLGGGGGAVVEPHLQVGGALDDVVVGQDQPVGGQDDAGALAAAGRRAGQHGHGRRQHLGGDFLHRPGRRGARLSETGAEVLSWVSELSDELELEDS